MVRWVVGSILHGVDPLSYFSFQPVFHDWCNKGRGMYYPVSGMVHIKEHLLLIGKSSPFAGSGFPLSVCEWSFTICPTTYNRLEDLHISGERDVAQSIACPPLKRSVVGSILLSGPSCSLGYFPFQPVVHNWFIKSRGMYCSVYGKVHIKDPLLLIEKSSLCGGSGFPSKKKCVNVTI